MRSLAPVPSSVVSMGERLRVPAHRRAELSELARRSREVIVMAAMVGAATGAIVAGFDQLVVEIILPRVGSAPLWMAALLPILGLFVSAIVLQRARLGAGTADEYLHSYHEPTHRLTVRDLAVRMSAAVATLGSGAPMGLEGPALYTGATVGAAIQRRLPRPFRDADHRTLLVAGAAAGIAAIFKAPATGAIFALEVPYRDDLARRMLLPALVSAGTGYLVFAAFHGTTPLFAVTGQPEFSVRDLLGAVLLGVLAGGGARLFAKAIRSAKRFAARRIITRFAVVAPVLIVLFVIARILTGESLTLGPGGAAIEWAARGDNALLVILAVLVIRCAATTAAVAAGGAGGIFIPLAVAGALAGRFTGDAVGSLDPQLFTIVGVAAFLGAGYRVPLASVMFIAEVTGQPGVVVPGLLAAVAADLMMGRSSVTPYQRSPRLTVD
jgi:CIC family chloride channel protein